jgi:hypothetical protein
VISSITKSIPPPSLHDTSPKSDMKIFWESSG